MAPQRALKVLNKGPGAKRFVFKTFAQRVEDVDVDVFRSLTPVKFEPTSGSSFFHENLVRWRELNCAADFNHVYQEVLPLVQTLPQLLLHKDAIITSLLSRVRMSAMLSLEPILSLLALLSRDLQEEFIPYLFKFFDTCVSLLKTGGDQEPELLEQVFVSISYVIKYLIKHLTRDILLVLRVTKGLRFYHRSYVQDFVAESVSFLVRKAPPKQLIKGIRRLFGEVEADQTEEKISSCCTLLYHIIKGPSSGLHSQTESFLQLLLDRAILSGVHKKKGNEGVAVQVVSKMFLMLCDDVKRDKLEVLFMCLVDHISQELADDGRLNLRSTGRQQERQDSLQALSNNEPSSNSVSDPQWTSDAMEQETLHVVQEELPYAGCGPGLPLPASKINIKETVTDPSKFDPSSLIHEMHLLHLLTLLNDVLGYRKGSRVNDYKPLFALVPKLLMLDVLSREQLVPLCPFAGPVAPSRLFEDLSSRLCSEVLRFLLALVKSHSQVAGASTGPGLIAKVAPSWAAAFECKNINCLITFLRGLIEQDAVLVQTFAPIILRSLDRLIEEYPADVLPSLLDLSHKLDLTSLYQDTQKLKRYVVCLVQEAIKRLKSTSSEQKIPEVGDYIQTVAVEPAMVWVALQCLPRIFGMGEDLGSLSWEYVVAVEDLLSSEEDLESSEESGSGAKVWEVLLATALSSHMQLLVQGNSQIVEEYTEKYLDLATKHKDSSHVLKVVGDLLENRKVAAEDNRTNFLQLLQVFGSNLCSPEKKLRVETLRILANQEPVGISGQDEDQAPRKRRKGPDGLWNEGGQADCQVFRRLLAVESVPLSVENCRKSTILITAIKAEACTGKIRDAYVVPLVNGLIGILHNRFSLLWDSVIESLAGILESYGNVVWEILFPHLEATQNIFLNDIGCNERGDVTDDPEVAPMDLWNRFDSCMAGDIKGTQTGTLLTLHLKTIQKVPKFAEARSRQLIPIFLSFVGHSHSEEESQQPKVGGGKDWKAVLREWLNLLKEMKNARALFCGPVVKGILLNRFLGDSEPSIQEATLDCLLNWKDKYLTTYEEHLKNLVSSKMLREELTTWNVNRESQEIQPDDRQQLLTVVLTILYPKIMKRTVKSLGKSGTGIQRNAVLSFLARLEPTELAPLFCQLLKPLQIAFTENNLTSKASNAAWISMIEEGASSQFIELVNPVAVTSLPYKRKMGFVHMVLASLDIFNNSQLSPYIHPLLAIVLRLLETSAVDLNAESVASLHTTDWDSKGRQLPENVGETISSVISEVSEPLNSRLVGPDRPLVNHYQNGGSILESMAEVGGEEELSKGDENVPHEIQTENCVGGQDDEVAVHQEASGDAEFEANGNGTIREANNKQEDKLSDDVEETASKHRNGAREIKTLCLRVIATVIRKFDNVVFSPTYWDIFFRSIRQSVTRFVDENRSSSSPGALMQCFVVMSQRVELAPLLTRNPKLVPNILSILSVKGASPAVVSAVLTFVENILDLVSETESDEDGRVGAVRDVLTSQLSVLLSSFRDCLSFHRETASEKRSLKRELKILTRLSRYVVDSTVAAKLLDVLLPMLKVKKRTEQELCLEVLRLIQGIGPILEISSAMKCLPVLAPLLVSVSLQDVRIAVSQTFLALAKVDNSLLSVAELLTDLNSMSASAIDEYDYGRRLLAYDCMTVSFFAHLTRIQALLVLSQVIHDMGSEDMSIRHRASDALQGFVKFAATLTQDLKGSSTEIHEANIIGGPSQAEDIMIADTPLDDQLCSKLVVKSLRSLVPTFILTHVRNGMSSDVLVVRREWSTLLREMVLNFPESPALKEFKELVNSDPEADFFHNIVHLQVHRRIKAMAKFKVLCSGSHFSQGALSRIFVPLFMNSLLEARGDKEGNLISVAVETLAGIAAQLPWEPYFALLMRFFRLIGTKPEHQKVFVRVVCGILDAFHFFLPTVGENDTKSDTLNVQSSEQIPSTESISVSANGIKEQPSGQSLITQLPAGILRPLRERVLPEVRRLMVLKGDIVSTPVALTQVKILKLMPEDIIEIELPQVIRTIINLLKIRSQAIRDEARAALVAIAETLGPHYMRFIVEILRSSLSRGFEMHVLGYTLNSILVKVVPKLNAGEIDYCLNDLLEVLENDIMGEVAEEKNVEAIAVKMKETKHMRSFESLKLLAEVVNFRTHATALLGPVHRNLHKSLAPKVKPKLESMLNHIALGLQHNKSVTQSDLLVIVHAIIEDGLKEEQAVAVAAAAKKQAKMDGHPSSRLSSFESTQPAKAPTPNFYMITEFALQLLNNHFKRVKVNYRDGHTLAMLNPLVILLQECLNSKYDGVLASALKSLSFLLLLPLPAIDEHGTEITTLVFSICNRFSKAESPLLQACLNVLIILIRHCKTLRLSEEQLRALLQLPIFVDMEGGSRMALGLLKAIVSRKLLVPELYDMMTRVSELMVTSNLGPVRQLCSQILLQFLLDYPLGQKRLQQHLDFFITNVGYAQTSGREAALEMLHAIILKFPDVVVEEQADTLFFPLVTRLVNEESNQVRSMIGTILKVLMGRVGPQPLERILDFALSWYKGADQRLWRPAAQVIGFSIEVMGGRFDRYLEEVLPQCVKILHLAMSSLDMNETEVDETGKAVYWKEAYFSLTTMEKLLHQLPNMTLRSEFKEFWKLVCLLLLHQHLWIRKVCGRLLEIYFANCEVNSQNLKAAALYQGDVLLFHPSWVLLLVGSFCQQLDSGAIDDAMGDQLVRVLLTMSTLLPSLPRGRTTGADRSLSFLGCDGEDDRERISRALTLLGWDARDVRTATGENEDLFEGSDDKGYAEESESLEDESVHCKALSLVFRKLQKIAVRVHPMQTKVIFRWFIAMASTLSAKEVEHYLPSMLTPLFKITEGSASKVVPEDLKSVGDEALNRLREAVGAVKFVNTYNSVRERLKEKRDKRKSAQKISVLVDPERNAKRKIKLTVKRQAQKKRKIIQGKRLMGL